VTTATRREAPHHNNLSCYKHYGCRLPACVARHAAYARSVYRRRGYGTWQPFVDAEPVRQHLRNLINYGISFEQAANLAGLYPASVAALLYPMGGRAPKQRLRAETAAKLLAVKAIPENVHGLHPIDGTGTRRRLQALAAIGFPFVRLGDHLPLHPAQVGRVAHAPRVHARTARAVAKLYDQLWNQDPTQHGVRPATALKVKRYAASQGWAPPAAWDDDQIDNPAAQPDLGARVPRYVALAENGLELEQRQGYTRQQAAERLGVSKDALQQAITRHRACQTSQAAA
jgi:AraC-like DNA-binding protein